MEIRLTRNTLGFFALDKDDVITRKKTPKEGDFDFILSDSQYDDFKKELEEDGNKVKEGWINPLFICKRLGISALDYMKKTRELAFHISKEKMRTSISRDEFIVQAITSLDSLNVSLNTLFTRLREWYSVHYPELKPKSQENYLEMVEKGDWQEDSMGIPLEEVDRRIINQFAESMKVLYGHKKSLEAYIEKMMLEICPNITSIAGANIGARLISHAGSLRSLSMKPSSTIQVYGAEKALFKHIITHSPSPKHGIIFQHPDIQGAKKGDRGKVARALSGKISIAARLDFKEAGLDPKLKASYDERLKEIRGEKR
jgi:nucleolar protein 56